MHLARHGEILESNNVMTVEMKERDGLIASPESIHDIHGVFHDIHGVFHDVLVIHNIIDIIMKNNSIA
jgi:hypothetical protein